MATAVTEPTDPQEKALFQAFKKFDVNGDGRIQTDEFQKLMTSLGSFTPKEINRLFKEADSDGSGSVEWREFIRWICSGAATANMDSASAKSFGRFMSIEQGEEAAFVEQATVSKQVIGMIQQANQGKSETDAQNAMRRKQNKARKMKEGEGASTRKDGSIDLGIGDDYTGFRLPLPVTHDGAVALMRHYLMKGEKEPLHPKYVNYLTTEFTAGYKAKYPKPVVWAETPKPLGRLVLVGDTHGQLADVLHIFHQIGVPSPQNRYLFNGDIADRGHQSVEIFMILFAFFLADPECIIIHRGNHENEDMNALDADNGGGFSDEVLAKYGLMAYRRFVNMFKVLSLCAVVEKEIFVVHGGLTRVRSLSLDYINSIEFNECTAPHPMTTNVKDQVFSDLLWSDPTDQPGKFKSERGIGIKFGPDLTTRFCMQNKLRFVVRSHQLPEDGRGYRKQHDGRCVTIFSASNYCGNGGNYGAVLVLTSEHFPKYEIYEHYAAPLEELPRLMGLENQDVIVEKGHKQREMEQEAVTTARWNKELEKMIVGIIEKKPSLWAHIVDLNVGNSVPEDEWVEIMNELVENNKPWKEAAHHWSLANQHKFIDIGKFLRRWIVSLDSSKFNTFLLKAVTVVYEAILSLDMDLEKTFGLFDQDGDGTVDVKEVRQVLGMFDLGLTTSQLDRLTGQIFDQVLNTRKEENAKNEGDASSGVSARIHVQDFLKSLTVVYKQAEGCTDGAKLEAWVVETLNKIGCLILKTPPELLVTELEKAATKIQKVFRGGKARADDKDAESSKASKKNASKSKSAAKSDKVVSDGLPKMVTLFRALDVSGDGMLQIDEFVSGLEKLPGIDTILVDNKPLDREKIMAMAKSIDSSGNGTINYLEFLQAFEVNEMNGSGIVDSIAEDITTVLFRHRLAIRMGCQYLDEDGIGKIRAEDFQTVLQGVNSALSRPERTLTNTQISLLVEAMTTIEDEPVVDYDAFLRSFVIIDTECGRKVVKRWNNEAT
eukprot:TRINITY_DN40881_c0_g1_i1.p1 TRINITY_DN40881_c0_g1~~TRINITY_DN40881_c0_g1_i1.p1  ORF type:complete len:1041 (-),score=232.68 TRINITY_DN40881_c0_g1_i1:75-3065(-)